MRNNNSLKHGLPQPASQRTYVLPPSFGCMFCNKTISSLITLANKSSEPGQTIMSGPSRAELGRAEPRQAEPSRADRAKPWPSCGRAGAGRAPKPIFCLPPSGGGGIKITCWQIVFSHIFTLINKGSRTVQIRVVIYPCVKHRVQEFPLCLHTQHTWVMTTLISTLPGPIISVSTCSSYGGCGRLRFK